MKHSSRGIPGTFKLLGFLKWSLETKRNKREHARMWVVLISVISESFIFKGIGSTTQQIMYHLCFCPLFLYTETRLKMNFLNTKVYSEIVLTHLSKSVFLRISPLSRCLTQVCTEQHDYYTGVPSPGHNKKPL